MSDDSKALQMMGVLALGVVGLVLVGAYKDDLRRMVGWDKAQDEPISSAVITLPAIRPAPPRSAAHDLDYQALYAPLDQEAVGPDGQRRTFKATLSIRNTSSTEPLSVRAIGLFGTDGALHHSYVGRPLELGPQASAQFPTVAPARVVVTAPCTVERMVDPCAAPASHFIVEWASLDREHPPLVETIMTAAGGEHSHVRAAQALAEEQKRAPQKGMAPRRAPPAVDQPAPLPLPPLARSFPASAIERKPEQKPGYDLIRYDSNYGLASKDY